MNSIKRFFLKYRLNIASSLTLLLTLIAGLSLYFTLEVRVTSNDECIWHPTKINKDSTAILFETVKVNGVTYNAGIRNGDELLEINGVPINNVFVAQSILNKVKSGEYADYKIRKPDGKVIDTKVFVKKLVQFGALAQIISSLIWLIIGFIVYSAKPDGLAHRLFFLIGILSVLSLTNYFFPMIDIQKFIMENLFLSLFIFIILSIGVTFSPFVMLYFYIIFPKPFAFANKKIVKATLISLPIIIATIGCASVFIDMFINKTVPVFIFRIRYFNLLQYLTTSAGIIAWILLIINFFREKNRQQRKPIAILLFAVTFNLVIAFYVSTIAPAISDTIFNSPEYYMPVVLLVLVPIMFGYAILKYHLLDVSIVLRNTIIYGTAMATVAGSYFLIIYLLGQGIGSFVGAENQGFVAGIFFLIFAFVFQSTKDRFQDFLTRRFYPEQFAYQKVLIQFSNDVSTVVGTDKILDLTSTTFIEALKINKFGILLRDYKKDILTLARGIGFSNPDCVIEKSNLITVFKEKSLVSNAPVIEQQDFIRVFPDKADRLIEEGVYSIIPMIVKSKVVGALLFGLKYSGSKFGGKDLELLNAAANQIAISLENARLYQSESEKIKIERDLDLARKIQQGLLPKCIPNLNGLDICGEMIPAMQVGGDYYDLIQLSDTKLFVAVGDVSGKGLAASLYMTKLQTMIQISTKMSFSPKEILIEINKRLYESIERSWFITMTLALFDTEARTVKFCRAGHMPLLTANNGTVESIKTEGIGLGLEKGEVFDKTLQEVEIKTKSNQIFAFFSDGITEAMNEKDDMFGEEKLNEILKSKSNIRSTEIMDKVWSEVKHFRGAAQPNDDMTMVIVKVS